MSEGRTESEIGQIQKQLESLGPDSRRKLIGGLFLKEFGGGLSSFVQQEVQKAIESRGENSKEQSAEISEDEWLKSVTDVSIWGKFPQGLDIKGKEFVAAKPYSGDFEEFSPTSWQANYQQLRMMVNSLFDVNAKPPFPEASFLTTTPDPKNSDYLCLSYTFFQDRNVRDSFGRHARTATISMRMPKDKARKFIQHVKEREDGADIAERFLQKAVPGSIAHDGSSRGVRRIRTTELLVIDEEFQRDFLGEDFISNYEGYRNRSSYGDTAVINEMFRRERNFPSYAEKNVVRKRYSTPVGFGEPEK